MRMKNVPNYCKLETPPPHMVKKMFNNFMDEKAIINTIKNLPSNKKKLEWG